MDLPELLDAFDRLVATAAGVAPPEAVEEAARVARRGRTRRGYLGETVVVALAGGTGSGKSSLLNAMAGDEVSPAGPRRPTTGRPVAWIPLNPEPGLVRLLDDIGIDERVGHAGLDWLAVIDLPDTDSVQVDHRFTVERLLPEVDAIVWVVDPEKYQDRLLHAEYLRPLAAHGDRFRFVLNQIDRVSPQDLPDLVDDLATSLERDGIGSPVIVPTAADPPLGSPEGVTELIGTLRDLGEAKRLVTDKIVTDLELAASALASAAGVRTGGGTGFRERWEAVREEAAASVAEDVAGVIAEDRARSAGGAGARRATGILPGGRPPSDVPLPRPRGRGIARAAASIATFIEEIAAAVGGETVASVREVGLDVDRQVEAAAEVVAAGDVVPLPEPPRWWLAAAWARRFSGLVAALGIVWAGDRIVAGGPLLPPVLTIGVALVIAVATRAVAVAQGRRRAAAAVAGIRSDVAGHVSRELDRRIGRPLREALRGRAGVSAAATEFGLALRAFGDRETVA